jgi:hypothetical protein
MENSYRDNKWQCKMAGPPSQVTSALAGKRAALAAVVAEREQHEPAAVAARPAVGWGPRGLWLRWCWLVVDLERWRRGRPLDAAISQQIRTWLYLWLGRRVPAAPRIADREG